MGLGVNASQVLLVPVAKGIFLELGEIEGLGFGFGVCVGQGAV